MWACMEISAISLTCLLFLLQCFPSPQEWYFRAGLPLRQVKHIQQDRLLQSCGKNIDLQSFLCTGWYFIPAQVFFLQTLYIVHVASHREHAFLVSWTKQPFHYLESVYVEKKKYTGQCPCTTGLTGPWRRSEVLFIMHMTMVPMVQMPTQGNSIIAGQDSSPAWPTD